MSSKSVVFYKSNALRKYLQTFSRKQRSQCCLIISSSKGPTSSKREAFTGDDDNQLSNLVHSSIFAITVEAGMRNVQSNIIAAYPTVKVSLIDAESITMLESCVLTLKIDTR